MKPQEGRRRLFSHGPDEWRQKGACRPNGTLFVRPNWWSRKPQAEEIGASIHQSKGRWLQSSFPMRLGDVIDPFHRLHSPSFPNIDLCSKVEFLGRSSKDGETPSNRKYWREFSFCAEWNCTDQFRFQRVFYSTSDHAYIFFIKIHWFVSIIPARFEAKPKNWVRKSP